MQIRPLRTAELVPKDKRAGAIALMFTGLTLANILGVPIGTFIGQEFGWRTTFWAITAIGSVALIGVIMLVPRIQVAPSRLSREIGVLIVVFLLGVAAFGTVPGLQLHMLNTAKEAPTLASTLNIAAFNLGNALGAYLGGIVIDYGIGGGLNAVPWAASLVTIVGILFTLWGYRQSRR